MSKPSCLELRSSNTFILITVSFAVFVDIFMYSVIVPVIPFSLTERAHVSPEKVGIYISALIGAYGGAMAVASPICGYIADHTQTRRAPFVLGLLVLGGATVMLHLGTNFAVMVLARVLQGCSAAVVWIVGLALIADTVEKDEIGQAMGYVFLAMSLGILLGPVLGGILFEKLGYNAVYVLVYCLIAIDICLRLIAIEKKDARKWIEVADTPVSEEVELGHFDNMEQLRINTLHINPDAMNDREAARNRTSPMILFMRSPSFVVSLWGSVVLAILMTSLDAVLPLYVKETFHWTSVGAGLIFLAVVLPSFLGPYIGTASDKYGRKWFAVLGFLLAVPCEVLLRVVDHNSLSQKVILAILLFTLGLAVALIITPLTAELTLVAERLQSAGKISSKGAYAQCYGLFNLAYAIGCLIGPLWAGFIKSSAGWGTMGWSLGLLAGVSAIPTAIWCGDSLWPLKLD